eukprot:TRINITY_DN596_c1_g2_i1.p1 TRINITY_DN596_c1_g2~~TRINITY_DN596_c1_g2_i1.p1  ORF type:complete len:565 (+),score=131.80 TRINITY_DN596_c1_g2_i1:149-1696(+)
MPTTFAPVASPSAKIPTPAAPATAQKPFNPTKAAPVVTAIAAAAAELPPTVSKAALGSQLSRPEAGRSERSSPRSGDVSFELDGVWMGDEEDAGGDFQEAAAEAEHAAQHEGPPDSPEPAATAEEAFQPSQPGGRRAVEQCLQFLNENMIAMSGLRQAMVQESETTRAETIKALDALSRTLGCESSFLPPAWPCVSPEGPVPLPPQASPVAHSSLYSRPEQLPTISSFDPGRCPAAADNSHAFVEHSRSGDLYCTRCGAIRAIGSDARRPETEAQSATYRSCDVAAAGAGGAAFQPQAAGKLPAPDTLLAPAIAPADAAPFPTAEPGRSSFVAEGPTATVTTIPIGLIAMWSGSEETLPLGWKLCDGREGRPDLRDKFIVGAGGCTGSPGAQGGQAKMRLQQEHVPSSALAMPSVILERTLKSGETTDAALSLSRVSNPQKVVCSKGCKDPDSQFCKMYREAYFGNNQHRLVDQYAPDKQVLVPGVACRDVSSCKQVAIDMRPPYYALSFIIRVQ